MSNLLELQNLHVSYHTPRGTVQAVRGVDLTLQPGEVLAIVGESGCGKSALCKAIMRLLPDNAGIEGKILVNGTDIAPYPEKELQKRLVQKGEDTQDAEEAVGWLKELHLLDDRETARQLVTSAVSKGYGRARIKNILYEKGIPQEYWADALDTVPEMDDAIDRFLARRWQGTAPDEKEIKKAVDALIRRGHSWKDIQSGLRRYRADLELEENLEDDIS